MPDDNRQGDPNVPKPWQPRFGLAALLMVMLVFCMMAAAAHYLVKGIQQGTSIQAIAVILAMVAPVLLLTVVSLGRQLMIYLERRSRR